VILEGQVVADINTDSYAKGARLLFLSWAVNSEVKGLYDVTVLGAKYVVSR
jgi:hypothetical protein